MSGKIATAAEIERARRLWDEGALKREIAQALRKSVPWVDDQRIKYGWPSRKGGRKKGRQYRKVKPKGRNPFNPGGLASGDERQEMAQRDRRLYGDLIGDVTFLRRRGWGVTREGTCFVVGNRLVDANQLKRVAARERRLAGATP